MYRKPDGQMTIEDFILPFEGKLKADNRWVKMAEIIPWDEIEQEYAKLFENEIGNVAKPARMALGALIIKEKCGYSDIETVEQIAENPYLQFFIGLKEYKTEAPFDPSLMVHFRKRFNMEAVNNINEKIFKANRKDKDDPPPTGGKGKKDKKKIKNKGKLIIDATCAPADIRYPTDLSLLNEAREKTEAIIDRLYKDQESKTKKPRTYRRKARKQYLLVAKSRKAKKKQIRKAIGQQLRFIRRNLNHIERMKQQGELSAKEAKTLSVLKKLHQQQQYMYENKVHSVKERIVSIAQPHIRAMVRGKAKAPTEFGAKLSISLIDAHVFLDKLEWDNYNEGLTLIESVKRYHERTGYYPLSVHADAIYRNRDNLNFCKTNGIRLSGPKLGRPPKVVSAKDKKLARQDARDRIPVEGAFGVAKRRYSLGLIMTRLQETSESVIAMQFLVMNLAQRLRLIFALFSKSSISLKKWLLFRFTAKIVQTFAFS
jgi:transposase, IS5 family